MDKCVRTEISKNRHGRNYVYTKKDYGDFFPMLISVTKTKTKWIVAILKMAQILTGNQTEEG